MVRPPAAATRDLLVLGGLGDLEKFCGSVWGPKLANNTKKWIFPVLGAVLGETPADQICLRAQCGPSELCLGTHVSLGPGIWPFLGGLGAVSSVGDRFCLSGTQPTKNRFGRNSPPAGSFQVFFAHRNCVRVAQLSYSDDVGKCLGIFPAIRNLLVFVGPGDLEKFCGRPGPKTGQKVDFSGLGGHSGRSAANQI